MAAATPVTDPVATLRPSREFPLFHFLDDYVHHLASREMSHMHAAPRFDLEQHENSYEIFGELPGVNIQDIIVEALDEHHLQISGKVVRLGNAATTTTEAPEAQLGSDEFVKVQFHTVPKPTEPAAGSSENASTTEQKENAAPAPEKPATPFKVRYLISERKFGEFSRLFRFATPIKPQEVEARLHNGILHVTVPSEPRKPGHHIKIDWMPDAYGPFMM